MKNIHTLPTNKPSRLQKNKHNKLFLSEENKSYSDCIIQNIHITNDEEIKEGDYGILGKEVLSYHQMHKRWGMPQGKKIILTTDADLVKDGVQAIDDEFLEWFVKNPSCEWVEIEKMFNVVQFTSREFIYKIIIPKEEPKPHSFCETPEEKCTMNYCDENGCQNRKRELVEPKPKQETLEEFIKRQLSLGKYQDQESAIKYSILAGAKWQAERMYSEEEVELIANEMVNWAIDNVGNPNPQSGKKFDEVIIKFKNK